MPITVYKSTDVGAPILNGLAGSLVDVLRACLVDGYGFQASMGWKVAFEDTNRISFKMPAHTNQAYLYVDDDTPNGTNSYLGRVCGYGSMSDIDTGLNRFGNALNSPISQVWKSNVNTATPSSWVLYTNNDIFYFFIDVGGYTQGFYFGYSPSEIPGDNWSTFISCYGSSQTSFASSPFVNLGQSYALANSSGSSFNYNVSSSSPFNASSGTTGPTYSTTGEIRLISCTVHDVTSHNWYVYNKRYEVPGMFMLATKFSNTEFPSYSLTEPHTFSDEDGTTYDMIHGAYGTTSYRDHTVAIQTSGEWKT